MSSVDALPRVTVTAEATVGTALLDLSIVSAPTLLALYGLTALVLAAVIGLIVVPRRAGTRSRMPAGGVVLVTLTAFLGGLAGWILAWLLGDMRNLFGVELSTPMRLWSVFLCAALTVAIVGVARVRSWRRVVAILAIPLILLSTAAGINADLGQYPTVRSALGLPLYGSLRAAPIAATQLPPAGTVGTVTIPATVSGFPARHALVYLPPAAEVAHPQPLPVVEMLSGQPGSPVDVFASGKLAGLLDAYAAAHGGVAPIVVVPDQLGSADQNPMCLDSPLGLSATYLTVDVPAWIQSHYNVSPGADGWTIAGFSQGGTCAIQLGAADPARYANIVDISGELVPQRGSVSDTITTAFAGDAHAYAAAAPTAVLAAHAPYTDTTAVFAAGSADARYLPWAKTLTDAAARAGMNTHLVVSPGTAHDWHTVRYAWSQALPLIMMHWTRAS